MSIKRPDIKKSTIRFRTAPVKFNDQAKQRFLDIYTSTGRWNYSAEAAGVSGQTVKEHVKADDQFRLAVEHAKAIYQDRIEAEIQRRGMEGWDEPVFNYKDGSVLGTVRKFSDRMLELHAKRHIAEYRDKLQADLNMSGGVLVINAGPEDADEWVSKFNKQENGT